MLQNGFVSDQQCVRNSLACVLVCVVLFEAFERDDACGDHSLRDHFRHIISQQYNRVLHKYKLSLLALA
jgi:hypothetical protein